MENKLNFGDYGIIEQKRHGGGENEHYLHKIIGRSESNKYVDTPVQSPATETIHNKIVEVISCICCGISETEVLKYKSTDVKRKQS